MTSSVSEILNAAADLLGKPGAWTQGVFARNAAGDDTGLSERRGPAVCWCALGATEAVAPDNSSDADDALRTHLGCDVDQWNDAPGRTQAEVVAALRTAASTPTGSKGAGL